MLISQTLRQQVYLQGAGRCGYAFLGLLNISTVPNTITTKKINDEEVKGARIIL